MERSHTPLNALVLGRLSGRQSDARHVRRAVSAAPWSFALRDGRSNSPQARMMAARGMVRPNQDRIGGQPKNHVEPLDETWVGGRTRGEGRGVHHKVLEEISGCAIEVRHRKPGTKLDNRKDGRYAGRVRLAVVLDRSAESLCGFVESTVAPGSLIVTDDWSGYAGLGKRGPMSTSLLPSVVIQRLPSKTCRSSIWFSPT